MATWTEELKERVKQMYLDADPTPETSVEIIKDIAEELDQSPNGVRMVLVQAGVYVKKEYSSELVAQLAFEVGYLGGGIKTALEMIKEKSSK